MAQQYFLKTSSITLFLYFIWTVRVSQCQEKCETSNLTLTNGSLNQSGEVSDKDGVIFICDPGLYLIYGGQTNTTLLCKNGTWIMDITSLTCAEVDYLLCSRLEQTFHQSSQSCFKKQQFPGHTTSLESAATCNEMAAPGWKGRLAIFINQDHLDAVMDSQMESGDLSLSFRLNGIMIGLKSFNALSGWGWYEYKGSTDVLVSNFTAADFPKVYISLKTGLFCGQLLSPDWGADVFRDLTHSGACSHSRILCEFVLIAPPQKLEPGFCSISNLTYENGTISTGGSVTTEFVSDGQSIQFTCKGTHSLEGDITRSTASAICKNGTWEQTDELICHQAYDYLMCKKKKGVYSRRTKSCYRAFYTIRDIYHASKFCADQATGGWRGRLAVISSQEIYNFLFRNAVGLMGSDGWADQVTGGGQELWIGLRRITSAPDGLWYEGKDTVIDNFTHINDLVYDNWNVQGDRKCTVLYAYGDSIPFHFTPHRCWHIWKRQLCEFVFDGPMPEFESGSCKISQLILSGGMVENDFVSDEIIFNGQSVDFVCDKGKALTRNGTILKTSVTCNNGTWNSDYKLDCTAATDTNLCYRINGAFWQESKSCFKDIYGICSNSDLYRVCRNKAAAGWRGRLAVLTSKSLLDHLGGAGILNTHNLLPFIGLKSLGDKRYIDTYKWYEGPNDLIQNFTEISGVNSALVGSGCAGCISYTWDGPYGTHKFFQRSCYIERSRTCTGICEFVFEGPEPTSGPENCNTSELQFQNGSISGKPLTQIAVHNQIVTFSCDDGKVLAGDVTRKTTTAVCKNGTWESEMSLHCIGGQADHNFCDKVSGNFLAETNSCWVLLFFYMTHQSAYSKCQEEEKPGWRGRLGIFPSRQSFDAVLHVIEIPGKTPIAHIGLRCFGDDCSDPSNWQWLEGFNSFVGNFSNSTRIPYEFPGRAGYQYGILRSISTDGTAHISETNGGASYAVCEYVKEDHYFSPKMTSTSTTTKATTTPNLTPSSSTIRTSTPQATSIQTTSPTSTSVAPQAITTSSTTTKTTITTSTTSSSAMTTTATSTTSSTTGTFSTNSSTAEPKSTDMNMVSTTSAGSTTATRAISTSMASRSTTEQAVSKLASGTSGFSSGSLQPPTSTPETKEAGRHQIRSFVAAGSIQVHIPSSAAGSKISVVSKSDQPGIIGGRRLISEKIQGDCKVCNLVECMARCHRLSGCVSYNYQHSTGICSLNKYLKSDLDPGLFQPTPGFQYGEVKKDEL